MPLLTLASSSPPILSTKKNLESIKALIQSTVKPSSLSSPIQSLRSGDWVKLICGASFEDAADIRNLSLVYTLAGVDCIDCAADASVVNAVNDGIDTAMSIASVRRPWVMISVNDDREDVHFRKAEFDPQDCPLDCSRPCEKVCPANAISLEMVSVGDESTNDNNSKLQGGVITERCYGCGRCFPVCPFDKISAMTYVRDPAATSDLLTRDDVDAVEIHTSGRRTDLFGELWNSLSNAIGHVKLVAVSLPDLGESTVPVMKMMYSIMATHLQSYNLWQLDGRPMSGDIGRGATRDAIAFAVRLTSQHEKPHGFYQLAGGTNSHTVDGLKSIGLFKAKTTPVEHSQEQATGAASTNSQQAVIGGIAYGGYARKIVGRVLSRMVSQQGNAHIEDYPEFLLEALREALALMGPVKSYNLDSSSAYFDIS